MADEANFAALKRRRTSIKSSCTRIRTYVDSIATLTPSIMAQLEERKLRLDEYWSEYNQVQSQLESQDEAETDDRAGFEEAFYALSAKIREHVSSGRAPSRSSMSTSSVRESLDVSSHVRLPKLNLPTFSAKYDEWFPFCDTFTSVIHHNSTLGNIQKFQYLRASLSGEACNLVKSLEISDNNYEVAWNLLTERYDNKRVIIQNHLKAIMELPSMAKENHGDLRQIADGAARHLRALQALKRPTEHWDDLIIYILSAKLDALTLREWQSSLTGTDMPSLKQFFEFITHRCQMLEVTNKSSVGSSKDAGTRAQSNAKRQTSCATTVKSKCSFCSGEHSIYYCKGFLALPVPQRSIEIRKRKLCTNCLKSNSHFSSKCPSGQCKLCQGKHNTLLHASDSVQTSEPATVNAEGSKVVTTPSVSVTQASGVTGNNSVVLSTALIYVFDSKGSRRPCRVLLDCGSQASFISSKCLANLGLQARPLDVAISGVNGITSASTQVVQIKLQSRIGSYTASVDCIVADKVTDKLPAFSFNRAQFELPGNIKLADPQFNVSAPIDLLIGAELFWDLLCVGQIKFANKHPTLQKTRLGWILAGRIGNPETSLRIQSFHTSITNEQLHKELEQLWQVEDEAYQSSNYTMEESLCEQHFTEHVAQDPQGRYIVKLPTKEEVVHKIGDSRDIALRRLIGLEKRFKRDPILRAQYVQFIEEYHSLGHMRLLEAADEDVPGSFYLPHHCVFKVTGQSNKIRVVFDASCKSSTGVSLNDALVVGLVVQQDLISILLRFRTHRYAITADVIKMYRQIRVHPSQTCLQRILWRSEPSSAVSTFELTTVTYGTSAASYLATRCLLHLAEQYSDKYPLGSTCVKRDFYVDDLLTGADTIHEAKSIRDEVIRLLRLGSFKLSKWASNCSELLDGVPTRDDVLIGIGNEVDSHVLGIQWNQSDDTLHFSCKFESVNGAVTKRIILSEAAKLFDPLGLLGPIIVVAKLLIQQMWQLGIDWDESAPQHVHDQWSKLRSQLRETSQLQVPRCIKSNSNPRSMQVHGFCDASQSAYGACVYIRTNLGNDSYRVELSAALLLARLIAKVKSALNITNTPVFLWSDSTITLSWIASSSRRWAVFVSNRVGEIQRLTSIESWRHVASGDNPADILSRGSSPSELANIPMWWHGPSFLQGEESCWPNGSFTQLQDVPEQRRVVTATATIDQCVVGNLLRKCSNLGKACRIMSYCLRLSRRYRQESFTHLISASEMARALDILCGVVQRQVFSTEYKALNERAAISSSSRLLSLSPFLGEGGLVRVGGRLRHSNLQFDARHPILLPRSHDLVRLIIEHEHVRNMHAGVQATMAAVRMRFWPLSLRATTRRIVQRCITCFKAKPLQSEAIMGSLPSSRVTPSRPFSHCGVDYAGPVTLREGRRRNARNQKAYIAVFVCFATKGVHIELVSDLTSDAFIAAFKRFISRRGRPSHMYSDNGTTFVGAKKQLEEMYDFYLKDQTQSDIGQVLNQQGISWNFIPPNAPHFGGLWEAAVKSAKHHMTRIIGQAHLTFEEMQTVLSEIEAILNSRPITPLSEDPNDLAYLTPGHFLVGTVLNSFPCADLCEINENRLVRWQRVEQLRQHFWRRWSAEYLHSMLERTKWKNNKGAQLKPNQIVLIKQQNLAPLQWSLGRVLEVFPGPDQVARTASVKTAKGVLIRPLSRLAILPIDV